MATRWGIAGAGRISSGFTTALSILPQNEHRVVSVAARDLDRANDFAKLHMIDNAYGSYEGLARDPDVEIVYIGLRNPQHLEVSKLMLNHGKHVLCEKPLTMNHKGTVELINLAREKGLFLMEAIWSRCFPAYEAVKNEIESGIIGDVKQIIVTHGFAKEQTERLVKKNEGGGSILDLGVYTLQLSQFIYGGERPLSINASGFLNDDGVDLTMSATLLYKNNRTTTMITHLIVNLPNDAIIIGTKGIIRIPNYWCPTTIEMPSGNLNFPLPQANVQFNSLNRAGLCYEAMEARACIKAGSIESNKIPHAESLLIAELEDELRRQIRVVYPQD